MKPKTRKRVVRAIEQRLTEILRGSSALDDLSYVKDEKVRKDWRSRSFDIELSDDLRSELENALKQRPEPTHQELGSFLRKMEAFDADSLLRASLQHIARKLPPFPPGKQPKLKSVQQKRALAEVARLSASLSRKAAYRKVARKYGVHWRTIQNLATKQYKQGQREAQS